MKIQDELVWDKYIGEHIDFVELSDEKTNISTLKTFRDLATPTRMFLVKSIANPL